MLDVVVVGAGPVGSHIACRLANLGYSVAVFEEHACIGEPVKCSGIIGRECVQRYQVPQDVILAESHSAKFFSPSGKYIRLVKEDGQAYVVDRMAMDVAFANRARRAGAEYHLATKVDDVRIKSDVVYVETGNGTGSTSHRTKALVIASGFGTKLPYRLGLGKFGDRIAGVQIEVEANGVDEVEIYFDQSIAPGFFGWLVPTGNNRGLVGLFSRTAPRMHLDRLVRKLKAAGKVIAEGRVTSSGIPLTTLPKTYADRVLVVGDAAGQVKPTTGGGIYYGLLCADIAVDVLQEALSKSDCSQVILGRYEREWKKRLEKDLRIGYLARRFYEKLGNYLIETMFRLLESKGIADAMLNSDQMHFDWHRGLLLKGLKYMGPWRYLFGWTKDKVKARL